MSPMMLVMRHNRLRGKINGATYSSIEFSEGREIFHDQDGEINKNKI